ncbi:MAG: hypothetical protein QGF90_07570, partial [Gammaproteobacteria bacterium]|nr:hypothetical protein [Gammaproteobacteria bacterium]
MTQIHAGLARTVIIPPQGINLIGYADRSQNNTGALDHLTITALLQVQAFPMGEIAIVAQAAEIFNEIGAAIKSRSPAIHTLAAGYSNSASAISR